MRISDWSSDVCSSDLQGGPRRHEVDDAPAQAEAGGQLHRAVEFDAFRLHAARGEMVAGDVRILRGDADVAPAARIVAGDQERKSAVSGKRVSVGVDHGGRRNNKQKKNINITQE